MKEKKHLFFKNLSDLSIRQFKKLYEDVDKSFIIIRRAFLQDKIPTESGEEMIGVVYL